MGSWLPFAPLSVRRSWTKDGLTFAANLTRGQFPSTSSQSKNSEIGEEKLQAPAEVSPKLSESFAKTPASVVRKWFFHAKSTLTFRKGTLVKHLEINFNGECDRLKTWYQNHRKSNHRSCWASTVRSEGTAQYPGELLHLFNYDNVRKGSEVRNLRGFLSGGLKFECCCWWWCAPQQL